MDNDKFLKLYKKFPKLLPKNNIINCDAGLSNVIEDMLSAIKTYQDISAKTSNLIPVVFNFIKIKYGGLEIEYSGGDDIIEHIIYFTKQLSFKTCEVCGEKGSLYCSTKWMHWSNKKTLCNKHAIGLFYYTIT